MCDKSLEQEFDLKNNIFENQIVINEENLKFDKKWILLMKTMV